MLNKRFKSIDIIKGIAMIMIILVHYEQSFGLCKYFYYFQMGCPIFFVYSGFGIICLISNKYPDIINDKSITNQFYLSKFKALAPGWYLAIIIVFLSNTIALYYLGHTLNIGTNRDPISIAINLAFLQGFFPFCNKNVMTGGWYIGATAILYFLSPIIIKLMSKFKSKVSFFY